MSLCVSLWSETCGQLSCVVRNMFKSNCSCPLEKPLYCKTSSPERPIFLGFKSGLSRDELLYL